MAKRVVVTGIGVVAPNGVGVPAFAKAMSNGTSGIKHDEELERLKFSSTVSGKPPLTQDVINQNFTELQLRKFDATGILYGVIAGKEAFEMAGLSAGDERDPDTGIVFGTGQSGSHKFREAIQKIDEGQTRRLGSNAVVQTMTSGVSAWLAGELGLGNQITSNSSACSTGTEALIMGAERIREGRAKRMLVGSTSDSGPYIWGGFDALRVLSTKYNHAPAKASRPLDVSANGFVAGSGAGALMLEDLHSALDRGATILAEVKGGFINSGGQRGEGSMTAPNGAAVRECIQNALADAGVEATEVSTINGHLTATGKDAYEVENWVQALRLGPKDFPSINSFKSVIGHCLAAAGSIELVGSVLQLQHQCIYGNTNLEQLHPDISQLLPNSVFPTGTKAAEVEVLMKASFGFGDVNAVAVLQRWS